MMKQLDILLPYAKLPADLYRTMAPHIEASALTQLLGFSKTISSSHCESSTTLPETFWLTQQLHLPYTRNDAHFSPCLAHTLMTQFALAPADGYWFIVQPSHFNVGMNQITLTPYHHIDLTEAESTALFHMAQALCEAHDVELVYGNRHFWFLKATSWSDLVTTPPVAIQGSGIDIGLPQGKHARDWRKLHNEIQMSWFSHQVNETREDNHLLPINGLWLWGGSSGEQSPIAPPYQNIVTSTNSPHDAVKMAIHAQWVKQCPNHFSDNTLYIIDDLMPSYLEEDWGLWLNTLAALDKTWFQPCLDALQHKTLHRIRFILTDLHQITEHEVSLKPRLAFWKKPSLKALQS